MNIQFFIELFLGDDDAVDLSHFRVGGLFAIRGPGEFFGTRQAGMPDLKVASLVRDAQLLEVAREEAFRMAAEDPALVKPEHQMLKQILREKWKTNLEMVSIG